MFSPSPQFAYLLAFAAHVAKAAADDTNTRWESAVPVLWIKITRTLRFVGIRQLRSLT